MVEDERDQHRSHPVRAQPFSPHVKGFGLVLSECVAGHRVAGCARLKDLLVGERRKQTMSAVVVERRIIPSRVTLRGDALGLRQRQRLYNDDRI